MEDLLICLPVLRHLGLDTKTIHEDCRDVLHGTDCSGVATNNFRGRIGRPIITRLNRVLTELSNNGEDSTHDTETDQVSVAARERKQLLQRSSRG